MRVAEARQKAAEEMKKAAEVRQKAAEEMEKAAEERQVAAEVMKMVTKMMQKANEELVRLQRENADLKAMLAGTFSAIGEERPPSEPSSPSIISGADRVCSYADCTNPAICTVTCSRRPPPSFPRTYIPNEDGDIWATLCCEECAKFWCEAGDKFAIRPGLYELVR